MIDNWDKATEKLEYDLERQKNKATDFSSSSPEWYSENEIRENYPQKYKLFNDWILFKDCGSLVDWADRNFAHSALSYAHNLIKKNCKTVENFLKDNEPLTKEKCILSGGTYNEIDENKWSCTNWDMEFTGEVYPICKDAQVKVPLSDGDFVCIDFELYEEWMK